MVSRHNFQSNRQKEQSQAGFPLADLWQTHKHILAWVTGGMKFTWTQSAIMSAKRERDFAGYMPFKAGSTILAKASISCNWGVAHLTSDCSDLTLELKVQKQTDISSVDIDNTCWLNITRSHLVGIPIEWLPTSQELQHYNSKTVYITFNSVDSRQSKFRSAVTKLTNHLSRDLLNVCKGRNDKPIHKPLLGHWLIQHATKLERRTIKEMSHCSSTSKT